MGGSWMDDFFDELKGFIDFPCGCKARILVYKGTTGRSSSKCPICGRIGLFHFDSMTSERAQPARNAANKLKKGFHTD